MGVVGGDIANDGLSLKDGAGRVPTPGSIVEVWRTVGGEGIVRCFQIVKAIQDGSVTYFTDTDEGCAGTPVFQQDEADGAFHLVAVQRDWSAIDRCNRGLLMDTFFFICLCPNLARCNGQRRTICD